MDISVVLPIHNEAENIVPLIAELETVLTPLRRPFEIIAVDDGSTDDSLQVLKGLLSTKDYLKVMTLRPQSGQTAALDAGFRAATGRILVTMDSDGQNDPKDIPRMIKKLGDGYDCICGWRRKRKDALLVRKVPSLIANFMIRRITRTRLNDLGCSLKVFDAGLKGKLRLYGEMHRFMGILLESLGARIYEMEVNHRPRTRGESKYNLTRTFKVLLDVITVWFMKSYRSKPIYVFGGVGFLFLAVGSASFAVVLYQKLGMGAWVHKNPLFILATVFVIVGVQFLGLGILAEIIIRTYFESQNQTAYRVAQQWGFDTEGSALREAVAN